MVLHPRSPSPRSPCSLCGKGDIPTSPLLLTAGHTSTALWGWHTWSLVGRAQWRAQGLAGLGCQAGMRGSPQAASWEPEQCTGAEQSFPPPSSVSSLAKEQGSPAASPLPSPLCSHIQQIPSLDGSCS